MPSMVTQHDVKRVFEETDEGDLEKMLKTAQETRRRNFGKRIYFYAPSFTYYKTSYRYSSNMDFPTISVTGGSCALKCKHCGGTVLGTMQSATTPEELFEISKLLKREGAHGCLISGGCRSDGTVPLDGFVDTIRKVKHELDLRIFVHTGIINSNMARRLKDARVDAALIDIIGSDETIKKVYNMNVTVQDYADSLKALHEANITFVPHIVVGLDYGKLKGELHALEMIAPYNPAAVVVIAFMPIAGTEMQNVEPSKPRDIAKVTIAARLMFPKTPLALGCMRPKGRHRIETDALAIRAGVNGIAFPTEEAIRFAETQEYEIIFSSHCCAQVYSEDTISSAPDT